MILRNIQNPGSKDNLERKLMRKGGRRNLQCIFHRIIFGVVNHLILISGYNLCSVKGIF